MAGPGDANPETDRAKRKREARSAFERRAAREALESRVRFALSRTDNDTHAEDDARLLRDHANIVESLAANDARREARRRTKETREEERLDPNETTERNCKILARMIRDANGSFVLHTGAGFSTASNIPDFRGRNGVWTMRARGFDVKMPRFERCVPTKAHMCCVALREKGFLKHVVTQNVDGLHRRAGLPRDAVSELHGTVYAEKCENRGCPGVSDGSKAIFEREFDVTAGKPHNGRHRHKTGRGCELCGSDLKDVVVQFGERLDDDVLARATEACDEASLSLVMGTSLKIPPASKLPRRSGKMVICNLQWTAQDAHKKTEFKMHARCDDVMASLCDLLGVDVPAYDPSRDAIGAKVLASGETFVAASGKKKEEGDGGDGGTRFGFAGDGINKRLFKFESDADSLLGYVDEISFARLSKRARRMKNPSIPRAASDIV
jgi:NAD-dependent SIR2 family protein deacetylase